MASYKNIELPIKIILNRRKDPTSRVYTCGDIVSGTVRVDTRIKTTHVTISFEGKTTTSISRSTGNNRTTYKAKIYLFRFTCELYKGDDMASFASRGDPYVSLPFRFRFPSTVRMRPTASGCHPFEKKAGWEHEPGHPLPPSMGTNLGAFSSDSAAVEYYLEARMASTSHKLLFDWHSTKKHRAWLAFTPAYPASSSSSSSSAPDPRPRTKTVQLTRHSHRLDPRFAAAAHRRHGLRSHLKELWPTRADPAATFALTARAPTVARAGHALPVSVALAHLDRSPALREPPPVALRGFRLVLRASTAARIPYAGFTRPHELDARTCDAFELCGRRYGGEGEARAPLLPADGSAVELARLLAEEGVGGGGGGGGKCALGRFAIPSFATYGIQRSYTLGLVLRVECAGKVFEVEALGAWHPIKVLPWPVELAQGNEEGLEAGSSGGVTAGGGAATASGSRSGSRAEPVVVEEEAPPPYDDDEERAPPYIP